MKKKILKSALSLLLVLLLCASLMTPAVFAESVDTEDYDEEELAEVGARFDEELAESSDDGDPTVVLLHANDDTDPITATITNDNVAQVFEDLGLGSGSYYGVERKSASGTITNISGGLGVSSSTTVYEEEYTIYRTASASGLITKTPKWDQGVHTDITIRMYYTAIFSVSGSDDGEIYLDGTAISGSVDLFADTEYTVTAKEVEDFTYTITGASDGEAFAPTSDMTITAEYAPNARATVSLNVVGNGTANILVNGEEVNGFIPVAASFEVSAESNTDLGNQLDSIVVTKNGEEIEAVEGAYGPAANGDVFVVTVTFVFDPEEVTYAFDETDSKLYSSDFKTMFGDSSNYSYGYADIDTPDSISNVGLLGVNLDAGEYYIYRTAYSLLGNPDWSKTTKILKLTLRSYYTGTFTVTGNDEGEVYLNGEAVSGNQKLYTDTEYTVTAKAIDEYTYTLTGATEGEAFTPTAKINVTLSYTKSAYSTITVTSNDGGTVEVLSNGEAVDDRISEGDTFTVTATPNADRGYKLDSVIVTKNGEEIEAVDGEYGPAADGDVFAVTVAFVFDPVVVEKEVSATNARVSRDDLSGFLGSYSYYGIAPESDPYNITQLVAIISPNYNVSAGDYYIYGTNSGTVLSPNWQNAKLMKLTVTVYYTGTFTVTGNDEGEVYLNGEAVEGSVKLYPDQEYTVTAKHIDDYTYTLTGAAEGIAFAPTANIDVTLSYTKSAYSTITVTSNDGGTVEVLSNGEAVDDRISEGDTFTVTATPNADRGYKLDSVVVTKNGEVIEAVEGAYGPAADGDVFAVTVTFVFDPDVVEKEVSASNARVSRDDLSGFLGSYSYYGIASESDPDNITQLVAILSPNYNVSAGNYYIYGTSSGNVLSPNWQNAKLMKLTVTVYYTGTFTVTGNDEGEVYLNGEAVEGSVKLYPDQEYTVTAKAIDEYTYTLTGATEGEAFAPTANIDVTLAYTKIAYATISVTSNDGGSVEVVSNGEAVDDRISEGDTFTVTATPNADRGYKLDSVVVTKNGEVIEAVDGEYGPAADGDVFAVTVTFVFDPDVVNYELHADNASLTTTNLIAMFDGEIGLYTYGFAKADDPDNITATSLLNSDPVEAGDYLIYRTSLSLSTPDWSKAKVRALKLRTYYNGIFSVTGHEDGEVYLNGEAVSGSVKLYTDETYTVTAKEIEEYICTVYGVEADVEFTPAEDLDVTASYMKEAYATVTVNSNEGGTVTVVSDGEPVFDMIPEGNIFGITVEPDTNNGYYVDSIVVTKDGEEIESGDGTYGPVADNEEYVINVTFAQATLSLDDCDVNLFDVKNGSFADVEAAILANTALSPEEFLEGATTKVEYAAYSVLGIDIYQPLDFTGLLSHSFGTSTLGGELVSGNTEKVRVTYELENGITLQAIATVTVKDLRDPTTLEGAPVTITYGDDLKAAIMGAITVYDMNGDPIEITEDDITLNPESLNARLLSTQDVTVSYGGDDINAACQGTVSVYVRRADCSIDTKSETITYGETPAAEVRTTPEDLDYIRVIAGIDGDAESFVSIDIPDSTKELMKIKIGDLVLFDIYDYLQRNIGEGTTLSGLRDIITGIFDTVYNSDILRPAIESTGFDLEVLNSIVDFIKEIPDFQSDFKIRLGQVPTNAGAYLFCAISADTNYTTDADVSYIVILPQSSTDDTSIELRYRNEIDNSLNAFTYEAAQEFGFGGDLYINDALYETDKVHTLYVGTTLKGEVITQAEPILEPGVYTETIYVLGGNYTATPLIRVYTVGGIEAEILLDDMTVMYDGEAHTPEAYTNVEDAELDGNVTYLYVGSGYLSQKAPTNVGEYRVYAYFGTDGRYIAKNTPYATLTITKAPAVITVTCEETVEYGDLSYTDISAANLGYTVTGTFNNDSIGRVIPYLLTGDSFPNIGEYTVSARLYNANSNYDVTIENATLTIVPREVTVTVNDVQKEYGDRDPNFTVTAVDSKGNSVNAYRIGLFIGRESGEDVGEYRIYISKATNENYSVTTEDGTLTIVPRKVTVAINNAQKEFGDDDPIFTFTAKDKNGRTVDAEAIGLSLIREEGEDVGEYAICVSGVTDPNYEAISKDGVLTIVPRKVTVVIDNAEKEYGDEDPAFTFTATDKNGDPIDAEAIGLSVAREEGENVGRYRIRVTGVTDPNYEAVGRRGILTIVPRKITVTIDDAEKVYGDDDPAFTCTAVDKNGDPVDTDALGLTVVRDRGESVGEYRIYVRSYTNGNYAVASEYGTLTIVPREVIVTINDAQKEYGDSDPIYTLKAVDTEGNTVNAYILGLTVRRESGEDVGEYAITVVRHLNNNYSVTTEDGTLTIVPRKVTVTINNAQKEFGDDDPIFTFTAKDKNGRTVNAATLGLSFIREEGEDVGEYAICVSEVANPNYEAISNNGVLTIVPRKVTVVIDNAEKEYGDEDPAFTFTATDKNGDPIDAEAIGLSVAREEGENVGRYRIRVTGVTDPNYEADGRRGILTITPRKVTVTIDDVEKVYGDDDPAFTCTAVDKNGDPVDIDTLGLTVVRDRGESVGEYRIYARSYTNGNYAITSEYGTLTIVPREVIVTINDAEKEYGDRDPIVTITAADTEGNPVNAYILGLIIVRERGEDAGEYNITVVRYFNNNYSVTTEDGTLTINPAQITVTINGAEKEYGEDDPEFTFTAVDKNGNPVDADAIGLSIVREEGEDAGEYAICAVTENANYEIVGEPAAMTINPAQITVTINGAEKEFGEDDPTFTFTATDKNGDPIDADAIGLTIAREEGEEVGEYRICVSGIADTNYALDEETSTEGTFTITEKTGKIGGIVTSYYREDEIVTIELLQNDEVCYSTTAVGNTAEYVLEKVAQGDYILRVSKLNHTTRDYEISVEAGDIMMDLRICPIGDANLSGTVTSADSNAVYKHVLGSSSIEDPYALKCADVVGNNNGLTSADSNAIYKHVLGTKKLYEP